MKKLISLLCVFVLVVLFNSCSSSDDSGGSSDSDKAVGSWKINGYMDTGVFYSFEEDGGTSCSEDYYKFFGNNSGKFIQEFCGESSDVLPFTWEKTSDPVYNYNLTYGDGAVSVPYILVFSEDFTKFTVYETESDMMQETHGEVFQKQ